MPPYGGEPTRGFDVKEALEATPRMFRGGEADLELVESYASGDIHPHPARLPSDHPEARQQRVLSRDPRLEIAGDVITWIGDPRRAPAADPATGTTERRGHRAPTPAGGPGVRFKIAR